MGIEIEIKLLIEKIDIASAEKVILEFDNSTYITEQQLVNQYFDTEIQQLRQWDMGLRIRQASDHKEQTIKTSGQIIDGLHKRPEYNVDIDSKVERPLLSMFPCHIWPDDADLIKIQDQLNVLFETNFLRKKWHVIHDGSKIEVVLDLGKIMANGYETEISEIELELLDGNERALKALADELSQKISVLPGTDSKAKRGYKLMELNS